MQNRPLAIVFDVFGTLINISDKKAPYRFFMNWKSEDKAIKQKNQILSPNIHQGYFNHIAEQLNISLSAELSEQLHQLLEEEIQSIHLYDDTVSTLKHLQQAGYKIAIWSNLATPYDQMVSPLLPNLDAYILSSKLSSIKPETTIYHDVAEHLNCSIDEILFIGDTPLADIEDSRQLGMSPRLIRRKQGQTLKHVLEDIW